jgi:hypothetical protein
MSSFKQRLARLEQIKGCPYGACVAAALRRLSDEELELLDEALESEAAAGLGDETPFPALPLGPEERQAFDTFCRFYYEESGELLALSE